MQGSMDRIPKSNRTSGLIAEKIGTERCSARSVEALNMSRLERMSIRFRAMTRWPHQPFESQPSFDTRTFILAIEARGGQLDRPHCPVAAEAHRQNSVFVA